MRFNSERNKTQGENNITGGILQSGGEVMLQVLNDLFNTCLHYCQIPKAWKNAVIALMHKKGNTSDQKLQTNQLASHVF